MNPDPDAAPNPDAPVVNLGRLAFNARGFTYDAILDAAADLFDTDPKAWQELPVHVQDYSGMYRDKRDAYRRALAAGAITTQEAP